jgi:methionyl-tRNA formyltransferase
MFDTIILMAGPAENSLAGVLLKHNPALTIIRISTPPELAAIPTETLARARLIGFVTPVIVPADVLDRVGHGAYNFHPGPPEYPGWAPAHFALYADAQHFGATVHEMIAKVDAGAIIDISHFPVPPGTGVTTLEGMAYARLALMFWRMSKSLAQDSEGLPTSGIAWGKKKFTRRDYQAMCDIPVDISEPELARRIEIFGAHHFGIAPTIKLHGVEFRALHPRDRAAASSTPAVAASAA